MRVTLYALVMLFGALVAGIGLVLLFRKNEQQSLSKIKIFGQEFQFSAPGLVVALAGCVMVALFPVLGVQDRDVVTFGSPTVRIPGQARSEAKEVKVKGGAGLFKLVGSSVAPYSAETNLLTLVIRYTALDESGTIGKDEIRLKVGDRLLSPSECSPFCIESVPPHSDYDMTFKFYLPTSAKTARLQMGLVGENVPEIPIDLTVSEH